MLIATDDDVARMSAAEVVQLMREAFGMHHRAELASPARLFAQAPQLTANKVVFTVGVTPQRLGFRVYAMGGEPLLEQLTAVYDREDGTLVGIVRGFQLGARRTAALGAVAADALARPDAATVGLVGTGGQALAHLWALQAVRPLEQVRVFGRDVGRREEFARRCTTELGLPCLPVATAQEAVEGADLVTLATTATTPVIDAAWVAPGAHVATLGPKTVHEHEAPPELATRADVLVTDSMAQLVGYGAASWLTLVDRLDVVRPLHEVLAGQLSGRTSPEQITLFCSVGLAGTEIVLATEVLRRIDAARTREPLPTTTEVRP